MGYFSNAQGQIIPQSDVKFGRKLKPIRDVIIVLVTTKNEGPKNKIFIIITTGAIHVSVRYMENPICLKLRRET